MHTFVMDETTWCRLSALLSKMVIFWLKVEGYFIAYEADIVRGLVVGLKGYSQPVTSEARGGAILPVALVALRQYLETPGSRPAHGGIR